MKARTLMLVVVVAGLAEACGTSKKATTTTAAIPSPAPAAPVPIPKPSNGVFAPGEPELTAIRATDKTATLETLSQGYALYTGTCIKCHGVKSIYSRPATVWPKIIDDMAPLAKLSATEKDAVLKYVLAVKGTQEKQ